jgi:hypothetical protein
MSDTVISNPIIAYLSQTIVRWTLISTPPSLSSFRSLLVEDFFGSRSIFSQHIKVKALRWPFFGLAYVFFASAAFNIVWNMLGRLALG